jgi:hypothetical protein
VESGHLDVSDAALLLVVVLSVVSLIIAIVARRHQKEANPIPRKAFEAETKPQIAVDTNVLSNSMIIWSVGDVTCPRCLVHAS